MDGQYFNVTCWSDRWLWGKVFKTKESMEHLYTLHCLACQFFGAGIELPDTLHACATLQAAGLSVRGLGLLPQAAAAGAAGLGRGASSCS